MRAGTGKLQLNLCLGLSALGSPRPLWRSFPRPISYEDPFSTSVRCNWISPRNPEKKRSPELGVREREKLKKKTGYIYRNHGLTSCFINNNDEATEARRGRDLLWAVLRIRSGLQASTLTSGAALPRVLASAHRVVQYFQT